MIMTSNIGSRQLKDFGQGVGFQTTAKMSGADDHTRGVIENALKKAFAPEFLNRIDDVVMFNSLDKEHIHKIIDVELVHLYKRIIELGYKLQLSTEAKDFISDKGFDANYGARPLKRAIQKYLEDPLAEEIIKAELVEGDTIDVQFDKETSTLKIAVIKATVPPPAKSGSGRKKKDDN
jgi:ATP-dependent Clp protease ATP-binding subunit ClpC